MTEEIIDAKICIQLDGINIKLIRINHSLVEWNYPKHSHGEGFYELHYIDGGKGTLVSENREYPLEKGVMFMTGPHITHEQITDSSNMMSEYCFEFEIEPGGKKLGRMALLLKDTTFFIGTDVQNIQDKFQRLESESSRKSIGYLTAVKSIVTELVIDIIRNYNGVSEPEEYAKVSLDDKRKLIADEVFLFEYATVTLDILSERLGLSRQQTQRFLKKVYGKSFIELRTQKRLEKAEQLISSGKSLTEAAQAVGYEKAQSLANIKKA